MHKPIPLSQILKLYNKGTSASNIAGNFGVTRQAISSRLKSAAVPTRAIQPWAVLPKRELIEQLYLHEERTLHEVAKQLAVSYYCLIRAMDKYNIERRSKGNRTKFPELRNLRIGDSIDVPFATKHPHRRYNHMAKYVGIKVTVRKIDEHIVTVTRVK
jgi:predicted DNA-binding protein YlxM (UPF0122 family)